MRTRTKLVLISVAVLLSVFSGIFALAFLEKDEAGYLDQRELNRYGWREVETNNMRDTGVGYAISTYMPNDGRSGNLKIMTYSYPFPEWIIGSVTRELAIQTVIGNTKSYDMTFTNIERKAESLNGKDGEVIYIDFVSNTPLDSIVGHNINIRSYGKFIIALFSPEGSGIRDRFVVIVSYCLTRHEVYLGEHRIPLPIPEDISAYDEMRDLIFNHIVFH
jgi:hypothetical protein